MKDYTDYRKGGGTLAAALAVDDLDGLLYECDCMEEAQLLARAHNEGAETYEEALMAYPDLLRWVPK